MKLTPLRIHNSRIQGGAMRYFIFLAVFALVFGAIVAGTKSIDSSTKLCGVSSSSCGVSADTSAVSSGHPYWLPGPAQPVKKYSYQQHYQQGNNGSCYTYCHKGYYDRWAWQPCQPVRNVVRFFHNRRPIRRGIGFLLFGRRCC